jgi:uncharacterized membrane protein YkoI
MKRHFIYLLTGLVLAGSSAHAQEGVIRVIQPDGTVQEAQIPARKAPVEPQSAPAAVPAPVSAPAPVIEAAPTPPQAVSPADLAVSAPKKVEAPAEKPAEKSVEKSAKKAKPVKAAKPKKAPKPASVEASKSIPAPDALGKVMTPPRPVPQIVPGAYITKAQALDIALDYAPPAKSYDVLPRTYHDGRFIYVVQFATENGPRDILIDAKDGTIINKAR